MPVQHTKLLSFLVLFAITATLSITPALIPAEATPSPIPDRYIVILNDDADPWSVANEMAQERGLGLSHVYGTAVNGFSATVPRGQLDNIASDSRVNYIEQDYVMSIYKKPAGKPGNGGNDGGSTTQPPQVIPTGIARINGDATGTVSIGVAVIDTGISSHPDLNVIDGINFSKGKTNNYSDGHGHGTHVAGTIAAIDNNFGVIGVAPGANLYAVKVLDNRGSGFTSDVIAGIDWVAANADKIDVANMSLGGSGQDSICGGTDTYHNAICGAVDAGVTVVVAAGNDSEDAASHRPAAYDEVITVSALADFDGVAGGSGSPTCRSDVDDTFANFSNFGADVDIIAPGVCILSTWKGGDYNTISGTSMASPHVAGAAALYIAGNPGVTPDQVKSALIAAGNYNWDNSDDGDDTKEPLLDVSLF
jgi:subtilisin family serine protease